MANRERTRIEKLKLENARDAARMALGLMLMTTGMSHLTIARGPFQAQVPDWVPVHADNVVLQSGVVELGLATSLLLVRRRKRKVGRIAALFFVFIFPGNISQYIHRRNALGLNTERKRLARLFLQPVLVAWALWCTDAV